MVSSWRQKGKPNCSTACVNCQLNLGRTDFFYRQGSSRELCDPCEYMCNSHRKTGSAQ